MPQHVWNKAHSVYNDRVAEITKQYTALVRASGADPPSLSGKEARGFATKLVEQVSADPYCKQFNELVRTGAKGEQINAMLKASTELVEAKPVLFGELLCGTGTVMKKVASKLGPLGDIAMGAFFVKDAYENGPEQAAGNFIKSATFYDITVEPAGKGVMKAMDGLIHSGGPDTDRNQFERKLKEMDEVSSDQW